MTSFKLKPKVVRDGNLTPVKSAASSRSGDSKASANAVKKESRRRAHTIVAASLDNSIAINRKKGFPNKRESGGVNSAGNSGSISPVSHGKSAQMKINMLIEEEKKFGVDHYDDDIKDTGNSHCLQAYLDFRAQTEPLILSYMLPFSSLYEMRKVLRSSGELYEIRECVDVNTKEIKAVKVYRKVELTPKSIDRIKREIELLKKLDHPNIMKIHNIIEDEDRIYLVTDNIKGQNLFSYIILKTQLSEQETACIAAQLASCMKYLHKHNVVIRRLKLETILFAEMNQISELRITDLLLFNYTDNLASESPNALEEAFVPPKTSFQGDRKYQFKYCHYMSAPELLPCQNYLKDNRRFYN